LSIFNEVKLQSKELKHKRTLTGNPGRMMKGNVVTTTPGTEKLFKKFPVELRYKVLKAATRASAGVVRNAARKIARPHDSRRTGTRKYWTDDVKEERANNPMQLWQTPVVKVKVYKNAVLGMVGPRRPWGNIANVFEFGGEVPLWYDEDGDKPRRTERQPPRKFMRYAADTTKGLQRSAFVGKVKSEWTKL